MVTEGSLSHKSANRFLHVWCIVALFLLFPFIFKEARGQMINLTDTPCPDYFQFTWENGELVGWINMMFPKQRVNTIEVEFSLVCDVSFDRRNNGTLSLFNDDDQVTQDILKEKPIYYKLQFPAFTKQPKITQILENGHIVCIGGGYGVYPGMTTRNLRHKNLFTIAGPLSPLFQRPSSQTYRPATMKPTRIPFNTDQFHQPSSETYRPAITKPTRTPFFTPSTEEYKTPAYTYPTTTYYEESTIATIRPAFPTRKATVRPPQKVPQSPLDTNSVVDNSCGLSNEVNQLAIGGKEIHKGKYPWMTAMFIRDGHKFNFKCVGNLVSNLHIITAAHCTESKRYVSISPQKMLFSVGIHDLSRFPTDIGSENRYVKRVIVHVDYRDENSDADIAVIILEKRVEFTNYVRPICLWTDVVGNRVVELLLNARGTVAGWNAEDEVLKEIIPKELTLPIVTNKECLISAPRLNGVITNRTFCAGERNNRGPCNGESGTGFLVSIKGKWYLRGIVASSLRDGTTGRCDLTNYIVFTDVLKFIPWISKMLEQT